MLNLENVNESKRNITNVDLITAFVGMSFVSCNKVCLIESLSRILDGI